MSWKVRKETFVVISQTVSKLFHNALSGNYRFFFFFQKKNNFSYAMI